jgi:hypothetical protein
MSLSAFAVGGELKRENEANDIARKNFLPWRRCSLDLEDRSRSASIALDLLEQRRVLGLEADAALAIAFGPS